MSARRTLDRRTFLRGMTAGVPVSLGVPTLAAMLTSNGDAYADGTPLPVRFGTWFYGTGAHRNWVPEQTGELVLPSPFSPLERHLDRVSLVSGLNIPNHGDYGTNRHNAGHASVLTGRPWADIEGPDAITIDQRVADHLDGAPRRSLSLAASGGGIRVISQNGGNNLNPELRNPRQVYDTLFGQDFGEAGEPGVDTRPVRLAYLDAVLEDISALRGELGAHDKQRLDAYVEGIHEVETLVGDGSSDAAGCEDPAAALGDAYDEESSEWRNSPVMSRLLAMALACNMTQVFSYAFTRAGANKKFSASPALSDNHHELGHQDHADLPRSFEQIMKQLAQTLDEFAAIPEGDGTLLDRTGIIVLTEVAWRHSFDNIPIIVAGGAGGRLAGGRHVQASGPATRAALTVAHAVGASLESFGSGNGRASEPIDALLR